MLDEQEGVESQETDTSPDEGGAIDSPETDTGQTLLAGKYKSSEDLEHAYKELESKFGQTSSEAKQAKEQYEQLQQQIAYQQQQQQRQQQEQAQYSQTEEERLQQDVQQLKHSVFTGNLQTVQEKFLEANKDLDNELGRSILDSVASRTMITKPWMNPHQTGNPDHFKQVLESAAKEAKKIMEEHTTKVTSTAKRDAITTREELKVGASKSGASVDTGEKPELKGESPEEYSSWRSQRYEDTKRV